MLTCLVSVKRVIDYKATIQIKSDASGVETNNVKMSLNPFDEIALEAAVVLKEAGQVSEIQTLSVDLPGQVEHLRTALARGADKAILVETPQPLLPLQVAKILKQFIEKNPFDLIILGKQSIDGDNNQTGQMLAALLDYPQATFASEIKVDSEKVFVTREVDAGLETLVVQLPAVITTDLRLHTPRYISLPNVIQARQKPLEVISVEAFDGILQTHLKVLKVSQPKPREKGVCLESASDLINALTQTEKVI